MHQKLVSDPILIFVNNPKQSLHERNSLKNIILKQDYQKALKKNPVPFNGENMKNKSGLELVKSHSSGYQTSSEKFLY